MDWEELGKEERNGWIIRQALKEIWNATDGMQAEGKSEETHWVRKQFIFKEAWGAWKRNDER